MTFVKWMNGLNFIIKLIFAIFFPISFLWVAYQLVRDCTKKNVNGLEVVLDIVFAFPLAPISWLLNIVFVITSGTAVSYSSLFNLK